MSFYTSAVRSHTIDPQFDASLFRSEFRLGTPDTLWTSNLRLHNIGVLVNNATMQGECRYNHLVGAHGIVRQIGIYNGQQMLSQITNFGDWAGFLSYANTNQKNTDQLKVSARTGLGYIYHRDVPSANIEQPTLIKESCPDLGSQLGDNPTGAPAGVIMLREVFPLLKALPFLHTGLFPDLRVVITYYPKNNTEILQPNSGASTLAATTLPLLVADEIINPEFAAKQLADFKQVIFNETEMDSVVVPKDTTNVRLRLQAFTNKSLIALTVQKKTMDEVSELYKGYGSQFAFSEKINLVCNGSNLLADQGCERPSQKLQMLTECWGVCNTIPCGANGATYQVSKFIDNPEERVSKLDYFATLVNKRITSLDIDYSRRQTLIAEIDTLQYNQKLVLQCFGTVRKAIVKGKDGSFAVLYV